MTAPDVEQVGPCVSCARAICASAWDGYSILSAVDLPAGPLCDACAEVRFAAHPWR